LSICYYCYW